MPEIFYRESMLLPFLLILKAVDPGLKIAGVTMRWESMLLLFLWFLNAFGPRLKDCRGDE